VEFFVRPTDRIATIVVEGLTFKAAIGHLDPPDTASGVASRVGNLGHAYADPTDLEIVDEPRYFALALFLDEEGFDPNAKSFAAFNDRLRQKHGV
jgi:hypothetical protein